MQAHPWVRPGHLFTKGPGTYKIPTANDIPVDFRVTLMQNTPNPRAVHSSKVGRVAFSSLLSVNHRAQAASVDAACRHLTLLGKPAWQLVHQGAST